MYAHANLREEHLRELQEFLTPDAWAQFVRRYLRRDSVDRHAENLAHCAVWLSDGTKLCFALECKGS